MKLATIILYFFAASASADEIPSQIVGRGRRLANDEAESAATIAQLVLGARNIHPISGRRLESPHDKVMLLVIYS